MKYIKNKLYVLLIWLADKLYNPYEEHWRLTKEVEKTDIYGGGGIRYKASFYFARHTFYAEQVVSSELLRFEEKTKEIERHIKYKLIKGIVEQIALTAKFI